MPSAARCSEFSRFAKSENVEIACRYAGPSPCFPQRQHRRIDGFVGQLKRSEMHPKAAARPKIEMGAHRFRRVHMMLTHEPPRLVSPDGKQREIDARKC